MFGGINLDGTQESNIQCSIPIVNQFFDSCDTDVAEKYDLSTSISVSATDVNVVFEESEFDYRTDKASVLSLASFIGPDQNLAFGANQVELGFQLENSDGALVADGSKFIGELQALQNEEVKFSVDNLPTGDYTVKYRLEYNPDFEAFEGDTKVKTLEKNIRIPKRIE